MEWSCWLSCCSTRPSWRSASVSVAFSPATSRVQASFQYQRSRLWWILHLFRLKWIFIWCQLEELESTSVLCQETKSFVHTLIVSGIRWYANSPLEHSNYPFSSPRSLLWFKLAILWRAQRSQNRIHHLFQRVARRDSNWACIERQTHSGWKLHLSVI